MTSTTHGEPRTGRRRRGPARHHEHRQPPGHHRHPHPPHRHRHSPRHHRHPHPPEHLMAAQLTAPVSYAGDTLAAGHDIAGATSWSALVLHLLAAEYLLQRRGRPAARAAGARPFGGGRVAAGAGPRCGGHGGVPASRAGVASGAQPRKDGACSYPGG
ncbi:hypothetical protein [Streptomyces nigrescens]|uniref:Uncharacterized protein n=1 Tax=Streptomyces nigrescens TaxID=1920 RepID=A0ABY7IJD2_STRNI|nr:hypothetical protein [Streptomyces libani]WAT98206.1 hypothetical protein STRLI_004244 [Streptomyces libani subsp. libani]